MVALRSDSVNRNSEDQAMKEHFQAFWNLKQQAHYPWQVQARIQWGFIVGLPFVKSFIFLQSDFTE